jgi:hypothetical protein
MESARRWPSTASPTEPAPIAKYVAVCLHCERRVLSAPRIAHDELTRLELHLDGFHPEALAGKVGFYAPSPGLILEHFRVERAAADTT